MKKLAIIGAGGHGKVVAEIAEKNGWDQIYFFDDKWPNLKKTGHWDIIAKSAELINCNLAIDGLIVAIGNNNIREKKLKFFSNENLEIVSLIHPDTSISDTVNIGRGSVIMAGCIVNSYTTISNGCIINTASTIDHDCLLNDNVHICPGVNIAGGVRIGNNTMVGIGSVIKEQIRVGKHSIIGAGSVVLNDICDDVTAVGTPAITIKKH